MTTSAQHVAAEAAEGLQRSGMREARRRGRGQPDRLEGIDGLHGDLLRRP